MFSMSLLHVSATRPLACAENLHLYTEIQDWFKILFLFLQICSSLISALMNCYLDDSAPVDAISERLRGLCPSLFSNDDAVSTKVKASLHIPEYLKNIFVPHILCYYYYW